MPLVSLAWTRQDGERWRASALVWRCSPSGSRAAKVKAEITLADTEGRLYAMSYEKFECSYERTAGAPMSRGKTLVE